LASRQLASATGARQELLLGDYDRDWQVARRVGGLLACLALELLAVRTWLNAVELRHGAGLMGMIAERGPDTIRFLVVRFAIVFGLVAIVFGDLATAIEPARLLAAAVRRPIDRRILLAHFAVAAIFAALCALILSGGMASRVDAGPMMLLLLTAIAAIALALVAFLPRSFWRQLLGSLRQVLVFAAAVSVGALAFSRLALILWRPLGRGTMAVAYVLLHPFVPSLTADPTTFVFGSPAFLVEIAPPCSGYDGLGVMLVFGSAWLVFHRQEWRFPHALLLIPASMAAMWVVNCVRVAALVLIGIAGAPSVALDGFHTQAGWIGFTVVALGCCVVARRTPWMQRRSTSITAAPNPSAPFLMPFLLILATSMVAQLASSGFEWLYALRLAGAGAGLWYFRDAYRSLRWRVGWEAIAVGAAVFLVWIGLERLVNPDAAAVMPAALRAAPPWIAGAWIACRAVGAIVTVPIAEELAFRGFLMRQFMANDFGSVPLQSTSLTAVVLSSLVFGALHGVHWLPAVVAGIAYGLLARCRGSIGESVAAHATTNALIAVAVVAGGYWQLW
jgi:exosortase E/protease (VPEID-CTERM system)